MALISSIPNTTATEVISRAIATDNRKALWFQNYDITNGISIRPIPFAGDSAVDANEFYIAPASTATNPTTLILQSSGGDASLVCHAWQAYQSSGGAITTFKCGIWS